MSVGLVNGLTLAAVMSGVVYLFFRDGWLALTIAFEFAFGRLVAKRSWDELFQSYRFEGGDLWPVVLVIVAIAPLLAAKLRHSA